MTIIQTHSADHNAAERILTSFYALAGFSQPRTMWFDGPLSCMTAAGLATQHELLKLGESVEEEMRRQLSTYTWWKLETQLKTQRPLYEVARQADGWRELWYPILNWAEPVPPVTHTNEDQRLLDTLRLVEMEEDWDRLNDYVRCALNSGSWSRHALGHEFWEAFERQTGARAMRRLDHQQPPEFLEGFWGGDGGWVARYLRCEFAGARFVGVAAELLHCWEALQSVCGWWHPFERAVLCSDRPLRSHWDTAGDLHAADGPALEFRDGHKIYAWHGVHPLSFRERIRMATQEALNAGVCSNPHR